MSPLKFQLEIFFGQTRGDHHDFRGVGASGFGCDRSDTGSIEKVNTMQNPNENRPNRSSLLILAGLALVLALTWAVTTLFEIALAKALAIVILGLFAIAVLIVIAMLLLGIA
ncbi:MAG: hypothetical protein F6K09_01805 [Merismopedia sp. SIO2A8]|nr:hypothetical protein [Merismopedia sp. SIO2A8]